MITSIQNCEKIFTRFIGLLFIFLVSACELPPVDSEQQGYRGLGMENVVNPRTKAKVLAENISPDPSPPVSSEGPKADEIYENVKLLNDLSIGEFTRLMASMTQWVSPEQGCNYCHVPGNFASEDIYTKQVARKMIEMTRKANSAWQAHMGETGVTCYTCHRGKPLPTAAWSTDPGPAHPSALKSTGQNTVSATVAYTSLPYDPLTTYLNNVNEIEVVAKTTLPTGKPGPSIVQTEATYGLMMHISDSLGVNCTHCHNSRSFFAWDQSPAARTNAWHAIRHVREINDEYINSIADILPATSKGVLGDPLKVNCNTCHRGLNKPLQGVSMLSSYPSLSGDKSGTE